MKAIVYHRYGSPDVLRLEEADTPAPGEGEVLVRVRAAALNPLDWYLMTGTPYLGRLMFGLLKPRYTRPGRDLAGVVEAVGGHVTRFAPGDAVFGASVVGTLAEFVCAKEGKIVLKPDNLTFEQAAAVPVAGLTALQGLRDAGRVRPGQRVLINGAAGGVGTFAVQIARALGAGVAGVCSTRNVDLIRSLGADRVFDYTTEDFTRSGERFDVVFDAIGNHSLAALRRVLSPNGRIVGAGALSSGHWAGPIGRLGGMLVLSPFSRRKAVPLMAVITTQDLNVLKEMMETGKITPVVDRCYPLNEAPDAMRLLGTKHARGKVVITLDPAAASESDRNPVKRRLQP